MFGAGVDTQFAEHLAAQRSPRQHALDGLFNNEFGLFLSELVEADGFDAAGVFGMAVVHLVCRLAARHPYVPGVDDHDVVTSVHVRCILRFVLAAQTAGDLGRQPAQGLAAGVHHVPVLLDICGFCGIGTHLKSVGA